MLVPTWGLFATQMIAVGLNVVAGKVTILSDGTDADTSVVGSLTIAGATDAWNAQLDIKNNDIGYNLGFGVMGFVNDHVGVRGDFRMMRTVNAADTTNEFLFHLGNFHYWRGSFGVIFQ